MPNYNTGTILGAATTLPATSAGILFLTNRANTWIVTALLVVSLFSLIVSTAMMLRYVINRRRFEAQN